MSRKSDLGQFNTTSPRVQDAMASLIHCHSGIILEPTVGQGDLLGGVKTKRQVVGIELDDFVTASVNPTTIPKFRLVRGCFFENIDVVLKKYGPIGTALGNPPYVAVGQYATWMSNGMKEFVASHGYGGKFNVLYLILHRLAECSKELIQIVPKDFMMATSARPLREYLRDHGAFTHVIDLGEEKVFEDADLESLIIFRWEAGATNADVKFQMDLDEALKDRWHRKVPVYSTTEATISLMDSKMSKNLKDLVPLNTIFDVNVGSVTGCDEVFRTPAYLRHLSANKKMVTGLDGDANERIEDFLYTNDYASFEDLPVSLQAHLFEHQVRLRARYGFRLQDGKQQKKEWWHWSFIRNAHISLGASKKPRIFVEARTRKVEPFWLGSKIGFGGGVYALVPKNGTTVETIKKYVQLLNSAEYKELYATSGMGVTGKLKSTPRALGEILVPVF